MKLVRDEEGDLEVQMAPLIDCVFLLLIFFLVATTLKKHEPELPVELPFSGASVLAPKQQGQLVLGLDAEGNRYVSGERVTTEMLHRALRDRSAGDPAQSGRIDADRDVRYESLIELVELCQFEGLRNIAFHTRKELERR
jgi:biopolymer transport protein ExbD